MITTRPHPKLPPCTHISTIPLLSNHRVRTGHLLATVLGLARGAADWTYPRAGRNSPVKSFRRQIQISQKKNPKKPKKHQKIHCDRSDNTQNPMERSTLAFNIPMRSTDPSKSRSVANLGPKPKQNTIRSAEDNHFEQLWRVSYHVDGCDVGERLSREEIAASLLDDAGVHGV